MHSGCAAVTDDRLIIPIPKKNPTLWCFHTVIVGAHTANQKQPQHQPPTSYSTKKYLYLCATPAGQLTAAYCQ